MLINAIGATKGKKGEDNKIEEAVVTNGKEGLRTRMGKRGGEQERGSCCNPSEGQGCLNQREVGGGGGEGSRCRERGEEIDKDEENEECYTHLTSLIQLLHCYKPNRLAEICLGGVEDAYDYATIGLLKTRLIEKIDSIEVSKDKLSDLRKELVGCVAKR